MFDLWCVKRWIDNNWQNDHINLNELTPTLVECMSMCIVHKYRKNVNPHFFSTLFGKKQVTVLTFFHVQPHINIHVLIITLQNRVHAQLHIYNIKCIVSMTSWLKWHCHCELISFSVWSLRTKKLSTIDDLKIAFTWRLNVAQPDWLEWTNRKLFGK